MKKNFLITVSVFALAALSCSRAPETPKNVIYLIGDGMGFGAVSTLLLSEDAVTGFEQAPVIGLC